MPPPKCAVCRSLIQLAVDGRWIKDQVIHQLLVIKAGNGYERRENTDDRREVKLHKVGLPVMIFFVLQNSAGTVNLFC